MLFLTESVLSSIPKNKEELLCAIRLAYGKLSTDYETIPEDLAREKGIEGNIKGTTVSVCDTLAYLLGWGKLILKWHDLKIKGEPVDFPETGFKWNELGALAQSFHPQYQDWSFKKLLCAFDATLFEILALIESIDNQSLYEVCWYEKWTFGRMIQFNTSSPMKNMRTKVRKFKRLKGIK